MGDDPLGFPLSFIQSQSRGCLSFAVFLCGMVGFGGGNWIRLFVYLKWSFFAKVGVFGGLGVV